ncbi:FkbM family methyltransferase [Planktotalea arctica]|uniref:FkbM family methyltransferase n=1 Tax=Planktotalea arctica TaxID=1481893 RepID=UPI003219E012
MKQVVKFFARFLGLEIKRFSPASNHALQLLRCLEYLNIDLILDVGANKGQFGSEIRSMGYAKRIVSFEPLPQEHVILTRRTKSDPKWEAFDRGAIGSEDGMVVINVSANSVSSSILPIKREHVNAAAESGYIGQEETPVRQLDTIVPDLLQGAKNVFLKIDTQGFEREVLRGGKNLLKDVTGILCELSMQPLYEGQPLSDEMVVFFADQEFELWAIQPGFTDPKSGRTLQFDGIFVRKGN